MNPSKSDRPYPGIELKALPSSFMIQAQLEPRNRLNIGPMLHYPERYNIFYLGPKLRASPMQTFIPNKRDAHRSPPRGL
jgi:hypothetical protein